MGFSPSAQLAKNVGIVIECCECNKWRVLYSKTKLDTMELSTLERYFDTIQYTCGDSFNILANITESENNNENDNIGKIFEKVKFNM